MSSINISITTNKAGKLPQLKNPAVLCAFPQRPGSNQFLVGMSPETSGASRNQLTNISIKILRHVFSIYIYCIYIYIFVCVKISFVITLGSWLDLRQYAYIKYAWVCTFTGISVFVRQHSMVPHPPNGSAGPQSFCGGGLH